MEAGNAYADMIQAGYDPDRSWNAAFGIGLAVLFGSIFRVQQEDFLPYVACAMMTVGLVAQFGIHLMGFVQKRRTKTSVPAVA